MSKLHKHVVSPTPDDARIARETSSRLAAGNGGAKGLHLRLEGGEELDLPPGAVEPLRYLLAQMAQGQAMAVVPLDTELTSQEAADYLNVSRPFFIELLKGGKIPFRLVGSHRRIRFVDLEAHRSRAENERKAVMAELAAQARALEMGY